MEGGGARADGRTVLSAELRRVGQTHKRLAPSSLVVVGRDARRQPLVHRDELSAGACIRQADRHDHLAAERRIVGLELIRLDDQLVRHERDEAAPVGIGAPLRLPSRSGAS